MAKVCTKDKNDEGKKPWARKNSLQEILPQNCDKEETEMKVSVIRFFFWSYVFRIGEENQSHCLHKPHLLFRLHLFYTETRIVRTDCFDRKRENKKSEVDVWKSIFEVEKDFEIEIIIVAKILALTPLSLL